ncbi:MAG: hypothetical protein A3C06_03970 [Candidatus Taylorbacteria bacterium RIFCSPHIGHO2_02_FULL_46_13]|uniref:methionyl-tRNA formyltransferase n=1 Tax=Candidatus Taylorbacteria bacterium RIFCSPHIGHO2_02_FULL_46_13 TaxID=1802312 RepID=A0A1G2MVY9_9BACT|nr:MAG: hypothetical protein A3C06_03970 [Candidatus Taylorbacteria bacterium RIFCSPHIGHO2_02_FULL_46_13]
MTPHIIFFGNSKYSVIDAQALKEHYGLSAVVTIPDRTDSHKKLAPSPVKLFAQKLNIPLLEADKLTPDIIEQIKIYKPDFLVVADYGLILPKTLLSVPIKTALNIHHSLLPKYRGPAPAPAAIVNGDEVSGVSVIIMTDKVDAGDIVAQIPYTLTDDETTDSLLTKLNTLGSHAIIEVIEQYLTETIHPIKQDETKATFTKYMTRQDGLIDLSADAVLNWRKIRAYGDWPGTYFIATSKGKEIKVKIKSADFKNGVLSILKVTPENKREMSYEDFLRGL